MGEEDKSLSAQIFKYFNVGMDAIYGFGCRYTSCLEPTPQELTAMMRLMTHDKEGSKDNIAVIYPKKKLMYEEQWLEYAKHLHLNKAV